MSKKNHKRNYKMSVILFFKKLSESIDKQFPNKCLTRTLKIDTLINAHNQ